ncbi:hypothetical protein SAMN02949497_2966 [Methylomagnum ishizawai]|uniref:Toxin CptA n=1 Tax=Methylomagnum ishizawai TaxID=1760988 RepID=A0A1Y6CZ41_9GAMM|nr:protein YgfX [Methylomagnum ishizawai]SMF95601.1 hypothetical protein SAMN02949497_2966 [Methylomagnum ishizawai]
MPPSSANSKTSLLLRLEPSRRLLGLLAALHLLAGGCAVANGLPWWAKPPLLFAVALSYRAVRRDYGVMPRVREVVLDGEGGVVVSGRAGPVEGTLAGGCVVTAWVVILRLRTLDGRLLAIPIVRDAVDVEAFRRLRVGLRCGEWERQPSGEGG